MSMTHTTPTHPHIHTYIYIHLACMHILSFVLNIWGVLAFFPLGCGRERIQAKGALEGGGKRMNGDWSISIVSPSGNVYPTC